MLVIHSITKSTKRLFVVAICGALLFISLFQGKPVSNENDCEYSRPESLDMLSQRWVNTFTEISDKYNKATSLSYLRPVGYFQMNANNTYSRYSNGDHLKGNWFVSANCQLVLDAGTPLQRKFDIVMLKADTLIIRRHENDQVYTQHYKVIPQPAYVRLTPHLKRK